MKKKILNNTLAIVLLSLISLDAAAQCSSIICPSPVVVSNDSSSCGAVVSYTSPVAFDACLSGQQTFSYTGAYETFIVPSGVTSVTVDVYGAQGGANWVNNDNFGGHVQADVSVTPGQTIYVYVGQQPNGITGGFNGGGNGETGGQGGGGASDIRIGGTTYNDRVLVAGGGGGAGYWSSTHVVGGYGGGLSGGPGYRGTPATEGGDPGTQTGSGDGTCVSFNNPICAGGFGYGGAPSGCGCEGYGGGGGWYGGAGSGNCRGGGGGSGYADPVLTSNVTMNNGVRIGHGEVTISWGSSPLTATLMSGLGSGAVFPVGSSTETYFTTNGTDSAMCSFTVNVIDTEAPAGICPADVVTCDPVLSNIGPSANDNCSVSLISYTLSGATSGSGMNDASGTSFNFGVTNVNYMFEDASGNTSGCAFSVTVNSTANVVLASFTDSVICVYDPAVALPAGTPSGGTYSGNGVSGGNFDPSLSGTGTYYVVYSYTAANGCTSSDSTMIIVDACAGIEVISGLANVDVYPNPTEGLINIVMADLENEARYSVMTLDGKLIESEMIGKNGNTPIDITGEPAGIYVLRIEIMDAVGMYKIIKQ